jgi:hypothetical protein
MAVRKKSSPSRQVASDLAQERAIEESKARRRTENKGRSATRAKTSALKDRVRSSSKKAATAYRAGGGGKFDYAPLESPRTKAGRAQSEERAAKKELDSIKRQTKDAKRTVKGSSKRSSLSTDRLAKPMQSMDAKKNLKAKPTKQAKRPIVSDKAARMIGKSLKGVGISGTALTLGKAAIDAVRSLPGGKKKGTAPAFSKKGRTKK